MKHNLLLIGDSIRRSYQSLVEEGLTDKCEIAGVSLDISCKDTRTTLGLFDDVIAKSGANIIHWNNGLHDIKRDRQENAECLVPIDEYCNNLKKVLERLQKISPDIIIWARITPVIEQRHNTTKTFNRFNKDIDEYNKAADEIMKANGVLINDLNSVIAADIKRYICDDGVHLTEEGKSRAASTVIEAVKSAIS